MAEYRNPKYRRRGHIDCKPHGNIQSRAELAYYRKDVMDIQQIRAMFEHYIQLSDSDSFIGWYKNFFQLEAFNGISWDTLEVIDFIVKVLASATATTNPTFFEAVSQHINFRWETRYWRGYKFGDIDEINKTLNSIHGDYIIEEAL